MHEPRPYFPTTCLSLKRLFVSSLHICLYRLWTPFGIPIPLSRHALWGIVYENMRVRQIMLIYRYPKDPETLLGTRKLEAETILPICAAGLSIENSLISMCVIEGHSLTHILTMISGVENV